jgi:hypothetical protein
MQCTHLKPDGKQCRGYAIGGSSLCYLHDPKVSKEEKREAQSKGGQGNALTVQDALPVLEVNTSDDVVSLLADTIGRVRAGELDIKTANCIGVLSGHLLKALELSKVEGKVERVERAIFERKTTIR